MDTDLPNTGELTTDASGTDAPLVPEGSPVGEVIAGTITHVSIQKEMRTAYLDYAMSVIAARALPDARDGMKPVQRRILWRCTTMGLRPNTPHKKSARIVGEVLGKYHPTAIAPSTRPWPVWPRTSSMRAYARRWSGNFGSIDGDSPAAMRYTEARPAPIARSSSATSRRTPLTGPTTSMAASRSQPFSCSAAQFADQRLFGIAVGMATSIPPHNLAEIVDGLALLLDNWERHDEISVEELMECIKGPDFPTGGQILGNVSHHQCLCHGTRQRRGPRCGPDRGDARESLASSLPRSPTSSTNPASSSASPDWYAREKLDEISDLRDESDKRGMSIVIELKRGTQPQKALNRLYKHTSPLQSTFGIQLLALVDGVPRVMTLKRMLQVFSRSPH